MRECIAGLIKNFVQEYLIANNSRTKWREPEVAFAAADDKMFQTLRQIVSPTHAMPGDLLAGARSVICYFLPFSEDIAVSNIQGRNCSWEWGVAFHETNQLVFTLNEFLCEQLAQWGYQGSFTPATHNLDETRLVSDWSHRHVAAVAGLGTFGLNNMLITEKGCCGRLGTVVTTMPLAPTGRTGKENCLYKNDKSCTDCVERCVNKAIDDTRFDRFACYAMCLANEKPELGIPDVCGKCTVNVPCAHRNPADGAAS